jgi:hypothetical protein
MSFRYNGTQIYSGSAAANPDTYYTSSTSASYVGGFIWITGSANIYTKHGEPITAATHLITKEFYPLEVERISGGSSAYIYVLKRSG